MDERRAEALAAQRITEHRDDRIAEQREKVRDDINMDEATVDTNGHDQLDGMSKDERVNGLVHEEEESADKSRQHIEAEGNRDIAEDNDEMVVEAGEDAVIY